MDSGPQPRRAALKNTCLALATALLWLIPISAHATPNDTILVSAPTGTDGTTNNNYSSDASISADGRFVAFQSESDNLSATDDNNTYINVFVRDTTTNTIKLVSAPTGTNGTTNNDDSTSPSISADGRYVAFQSMSDNLSAADDNATINVFVRDTATNTTTLVSSSSTSPSISADGHHVTFSSDLDSLSATDNNEHSNVFVRDLTTNAITLVSAPSGTSDGTGNTDNSSFPSISADGRFVAFESGSDNLWPTDQTFTNVFLRDTTTNTTTLVNAATGTDNTGHSFNPSVSADGRYVAFQSISDNLVGPDNATYADVFVRDTTTTTPTLVSAPTGTSDGTTNNDHSLSPSISADGRYVAFQSGSDNLSTTDDNDWSNTFVRDTTTNTTTLVSAPTGTDGTGNNGDSANPSISADGRFVAFQSESDNLSADDKDDFANVYRRQIGPDLCHGLAVTIPGTSASEPINGTTGNDVIAGLGGNDVITGGGGSDTICGGSGDDTLVGGVGADWLEGGAGTDLVSYSDRSEVLRITLDLGTGDDGSSLDGGPGERDNIVQVEKAIGGSGNDLMIGNGSANTLTGLGGNDTLLGGVGNDSLSGGPGDDTLNGSTGADRFDGGTGTDTVSYTDRNSTTIVTIDNIANDGYTADGPATARDNVLGSVENLTGGGGNDTLKGSSIANRLIGMKGADRFYGNGGNDTLLAKDGIKDVTIDGGTGTDAVGRDSIDPTPINVP